MPKEEKLELTLRALLLTSLHSLDIDSQVEILVKAGWGNKEIGIVTGLAPEAIGMRKLRKRKGKS
jgi:hypothetical protein